MKSNIIKILKKLISAVVCLAFTASLVSCLKDYDYQDEITAIKHFMKYQQNPDNLMISTLEKYEVSEREIYYSVVWYEEKEDTDNEKNRLLLIYNPETTLIKLVFFSDLQYGLHSDINSKWQEVRQTPTMIFTQDEISNIKQKAIDQLNIENAVKNQ